MAISFITEISETKVLNAFNNNVVEYNSDSSLIPIKSIITILGEGLEITPNTNGVFRYNFKEIVKKLINLNYFRDTIEPDLQTSLTYLDNTVYKEFTVEFKIQFNDLSEENIVKRYKFLKSVDQLEAFRKKLINSNNTSIAILTPFTDVSNNTYYSTYFEGYPFDISIYSNENRIITILNKKIGQSTTITLYKGVNRLFVSDGGNNFSLKGELPIYLGVNELEFKVSATEYITLFLKKNKSDCGVYLKWFNNEGGWNYFLFNYRSAKINSRSIGVLNRDFENLISTQESEIGMGQKSSESITIQAKGLKEYENKIINGLIETPKIYRYLNNIFQKPNNEDWIDQRIETNNIELLELNKKLYRCTIKLGKSKRNTMTL